MKLFFTALYNLPSVKSTIWRGIRGDVSNQYHDDHIWWDVSSCTLIVEMVEQFIGSTGPRTLFTIECVSGKPIGAHSHYQIEEEIILLPGTYFRVVGKFNPSKDLHIIHLRETKPAWEIIAPPFGSSSVVTQAPSSSLIVNTNSTPSLTVLKKQDPPNAHSLFAKPFLPEYVNGIHTNTAAAAAQNFVTMTGNNQYSGGFNQLGNLYSARVDDDENVYIADWNNGRFLKWKYGTTNGHTIIGGTIQGNRANRLNGPTDVIIDKGKHSLIISDNGNRRVVRCSLQVNSNIETIISNVNCGKLAMANNGCLYISCFTECAIKRWRPGETYGTVVAGGQGKGNNLNQLSFLQGVVFDQLGTVYVADTENHRIVKWFEGNRQGHIVLDGKNLGRGIIQLNKPNILSFDRHDYLYVVDNKNGRVQRFNPDFNS